MEFKDGDIVIWSYSDSKLKTMDLERQAGTLYWCNSQIAIFKSGFFIDTYWGLSGECKKISFEEIGKNIDVKYIANMSDLDNKQESERAYYADRDCVNLNHANNTRGNFYIRKGAKKSLDKMRKIALRDIKNLESEIDYKKSQLRAKKHELSEIDIDSRIYIASGASLFD